MEKLAYLSKQFGPIEMNLMTNLRRSIDPTEIANRGKMLAIASAKQRPPTNHHPLEQQGVISRG
jgi:glycolate oxidase